jgi:hypothetical protein
MRDEDFRGYLTAEYRTRTSTYLKPGPVADAVANCRRVEAGLMVDLDRELRATGLDPEPLVERMNAGAERFHIQSSSEYQERKVLANLRYAVRRYADFLRART